MKTNEKRELSYFQSLLGKYISEHHPELSNDKAFLSSRADEALNVYANAITLVFQILKLKKQQMRFCTMDSTFPSMIQFVESIIE